MKQSADDVFKFDENITKFSKRVENTVGKGEIDCYKQFLLSPQGFQKACFPGASKGVIVWEWVKTGPNSKNLQLTNERVAQIIRFVLDKEEDILGKGQNAGGILGKGVNAGDTECAV